MRAVVQRVLRAAVRVEGQTIGEIGSGLLVLLGIGQDDDLSDIKYLADKIVNLRIFEDEEGKMNLSALDKEAELLIVSQFTLYGDCRKGRRPSFSLAATPENARGLYEQFLALIGQYGLKVATGEFQAMMDVELVNTGPVTMLLESKRLF